MRSVLGPGAAPGRRDPFLLCLLKLCLSCASLGGGVVAPPWCPDSLPPWPSTGVLLPLGALDKRRARFLVVAVIGSDATGICDLDV